MSITNRPRASQVMIDIYNGKHTSEIKRITLRSPCKFANFGSVATDSLFLQQVEADRQLKEIQDERAMRLAKQKFV